MTVKYLSQQEAIDIDVALFNDYGFSVDQLMELAGLSCASAISKSYPDEKFKKKSVLVVCGPGNNGGDGLVLSRHLQQFGYRPVVYYPRPGKGSLFSNLVKQCTMAEIPFVGKIEEIDWPTMSIVVDALFGFSYKPPCRPDYLPILERMSSLKSAPLVSVDIPSGWHVENGSPSDGQTPVLNPDCLISLTAPKQCAKHFRSAHHWLGGRFVPEPLARKYELNLPKYEREEQCVKL